MIWAIPLLLLAGLGIALWRRRSQQALLRAMQRNERVRLPAAAHPGDLAVAQAYHRLRSRAREELKTIDSQRNELRALLSGMTDAVIAVDRAERVLTINAACRKLFECPLGENVVGRAFLEVCRNPHLHQILRETLRSDLPIVRDMHLTGQMNCHLQISGTPYESPAHRKGVVLVMRDVSRVRRLEEHRREFVANVSHELKTPITSVKGYAETLLEGALEDPETSRRFVKVILDQSNRLTALVEDLLQLSRIEQSEEEDANFEINALRPLLAEALELARQAAEERAIDIQIDCPKDLLVRCNSGMLELAVRNLAENAVKYSQEGARVEVAAGMDNGLAQIQVKDNGPGIASQHHERLFERFFRVEKSRSKALGGTGLGLAIVKHIAQAHRGTVRVDSAVGIGTTFTIEWPG